MNMMKRSIIYGVWLILASSILLTGCRTKAAKEDLVITHSNQYVMPHKVRELQVGLGTSMIYNTIRDDAFSIQEALDLDFQYGITPRLTYRFPLVVKYELLPSSPSNHLVVGGSLDGFILGGFGIALIQGRMFGASLYALYAHDLSASSSLYASIAMPVRLYVLEGMDAFADLSQFFTVGWRMSWKKFVFDHSLGVGKVSEPQLFYRPFQVQLTEEITYPVYKGLHVYTQASLFYSNPSFYNYKFAYSTTTYRKVVSPALMNIVGVTWRY